MEAKKLKEDEGNQLLPASQQIHDDDDDEGYEMENSKNSSDKPINSNENPTIVTIEVDEPSEEKNHNGLLVAKKPNKIQSKKNNYLRVNMKDEDEEEEEEEEEEEKEDEEEEEEEKEEEAEEEEEKEDEEEEEKAAEEKEKEKGSELDKQDKTKTKKEKIPKTDLLKELQKKDAEVDVEVDEGSTSFFGDEIQLLPRHSFVKEGESPSVSAPKLSTKPKSRVLLLDYTATKRTESSWLRTCLSMVGIGIVLAKIFDRKREDIGIVFIVLAAIYFILAYAHFQREHLILSRKKSILVNTWMIGFCSFFTFCAYILLMAFMDL